MGSSRARLIPICFLSAAVTPETIWTASSRAETPPWSTGSSRSTGKPNRRSSRSPGRRRTSTWWRRTQTWTPSWRWGPGAVFKRIIFKPNETWLFNRSFLLQVFHSIQRTSLELLKVIELYQRRICCKSYSHKIWLSHQNLCFSCEFTNLSPSLPSVQSFLRRRTSWVGSCGPRARRIKPELERSCRRRGKLSASPPSRGTEPHVTWRNVRGVKASFSWTLGPAGWPSGSICAVCTRRSRPSGTGPSPTRGWRWTAWSSPGQSTAAPCSGWRTSPRSSIPIQSNRWRSSARCAAQFVYSKTSAGF